MARATDVERARFLLMLDCLTDVELAKPYIIMESKEGKSLSELGIKYNYTKRQIQYIIECNKNRYEISKEVIKE